jgi:putative endonuclease
MVRCADGSLYTGITTDVERRFAEHQNIDGSGKGAKALRGKHPLSLVYQTTVGNRSEALKLEYRVKQLSKTDKEALASRQSNIESIATD